MDKYWEKYSMEKWGKNIYQDAIDEWGENAQFDQLIEEMAELTVALSKYKRLAYDNMLGKPKEKIFDNLFEEIADVKMMIEEMEYIFGKEKVDEWYDKKMKKFMLELYGPESNK